METEVKNKLDNQEDDFDLSGLIKDDSKKEENVEKEEFQQEETEKKEEIKKEEKEEIKEEKTENKEEEEKKEVENKEEFSDDFFAGEIKEEKKNEVFDIKSLATDFEIEAETPEDFREKMKAKIESSKQDIKLDGYSADAQSLIKHLNDNGGKIEDFFTNKNINSYQGIIALEPEKKVLAIRTNELVTNNKLSVEEAETQALEEISSYSTRELKDIADRIDNDAKNLISKEVQGIVKQRETIVQQQQQQKEQQVKNEINNLKKFVTTQKEFMGIPLTPKAIQSIVQDIETGVFDQVANKTPEASKFHAYMLNLHGSRIAERLNNKVSEQNRVGYNAAQQKNLSALHKSEEEAQRDKTGHSKKSEQKGSKFGSWSDDIFSSDSE